jgi:hypothetical protein
MCLPLPHTPTVTPELIRMTFWGMLAEGWFPVGNDYSTMVKVIADTFYIYGSAPVVAIMDAASIMHVGSVANDKLLLVEARKRYLCAINGLRLETNRKESGMAVSGILILALGIMAGIVRTSE